MSEPSLTDFLLARIAEDEAAARDVPPLDHNYDMGGNRQDERWIFDRTLPSSADGMGNWSKHRHSPTTAAHFSRYDPARVLAECEAKRRIVTLGPTPCPMREPAYDGDDDLGAQHHYPDAGWQRYPHYEACDSCKESASADHVWRSALRALALPYADHPDYREEWAP